MQEDEYKEYEPRTPMAPGGPKAPDDPEAPGDPPDRGRRKLLRGLGAAAGLGALGAGAVAAYEGYSRGIIFRSGEGSDHAIKDYRVTLPDAVPRLVIARGKNPAANVAAALSRMGGMERFVAKGEVVLVKPNAAFNRTPEQAATTNPEVVAEVVRACRSAGAGEVIVSDCPGHNADMAFSRSRIRQKAAEAGAKVVLPLDSHYVTATLPGFGPWPVLHPYIAVDKVINVPLVKHHARAKATIGMKNWFGVLGGFRGDLHDKIDDAIVALALLMRPTLTIVDATRVLLRNGPTGGNLNDVKRMDAVAASLDPVAVDTWGVELLGANPAEMGWLKKAEARGLGTMHYRSLGPIELKTG